MNPTFPIFLTKDGDYYLVEIPDFEIYTQGINYDDAIFMAKDVIELVVQYRKDIDEKFPIKSKTEIKIEESAFYEPNNTQLVYITLSADMFCEDGEKNV